MGNRPGGGYRRGTNPRTATVQRPRPDMTYEAPLRVPPGTNPGVGAPVRDPSTGEFPVYTATRRDPAAYSAGSAYNQNYAENPPRAKKKKKKKHQGSGSGNGSSGSSGSSGSNSGGNSGSNGGGSSRGSRGRGRGRGGSGGGSGGSSSSGTSSSSNSSSSTSSTSSTSTTPSTAEQRKLAEEGVSLELNPRINEIIRQRNLLSKTNSDQLNQSTELGRRYSSDLQYLYSNLDKFLAERNASVGTNFDTASSAIDQKYANLLKSLQESSGAVAGADAADAARLGLAPTGETGSQQDAEFLQGLAGTNRANAAAMLASQKANSTSVGELLRGAEQSRGTKENADFQNVLARERAQSLRDYNMRDFDLRQQQVDIEAQRGAMIRQAMALQEQQAYDRAAEQQQQQLMNQLALGKFNLSVDAQRSNQAYQKAQLAQNWAKIRLASQEAQARIADMNRRARENNNPQNVLHLNKATKFLQKAVTTLVPSEIENRGIPADPAQSPQVAMAAWNAAYTAGEVDFNDGKQRAQVINTMRQYLANNYPEYNITSMMSALTRAYDIYIGNN